MSPFKFLFYKRNSVIGDSAKVYPFTIIKNCVVGDFTYISYFCNINNSTIGKFCSIAQNVKIGLGKHPTNFVSSSPLFYTPTNPLKRIISQKCYFKEYETVSIGNDVWIGTNVTILDGITIGNGSIVGANSVVTKDIEPYTIVGGVPSKQIKKRFEKEIIELLEKSNWWEMPLEFFEKNEVQNIFTKKLTYNDVINLMRLIKKYKTDYTGL